MIQQFLAFTKKIIIKEDCKETVITTVFCLTYLIPVVRGADDFEGVALLHLDLPRSHFRHPEGTNGPHQ